MRKLRTVFFFASLCISPVTFAKAPAGQGRACDAKNRCDAGLQCVPKRPGKATCEIVCAANSKCPEDQRCVIDGEPPQHVCRPIYDGVGL